MGFLHGITRTTERSRVEPLRPQHWRLSDTGTYDLARKLGAKITWIISDTWHQTTYSEFRQGPAPPWENWPQYEAFVRDLVRRSITTNRPVDFWDVINEPGTPETGPGNATLYLEQYRHAHDAIRSVDPDAGIVGPSSGSFADEPYGHTGNRHRWGNVDLKTFLDYVTAFNLHFDALSWHEHTSDPRYQIPARSPADIVDHVRRARKLIAAAPTNDHMEIHINEYTTWETRHAPGWNAGWIAALEEADVDASMRACAREREADGPEYSGCAVGTLDGLLLRDEKTPRPTYWVYRAYASMTGMRVPAAATNKHLTGYATRSSDGRELRVLVGKHERCAPTTTSECRNEGDAGTADVDIEIHVPFRDGAQLVTVEQIPSQPTALDAPRPVLSGKAVLSEWISVRLANARDGDAFTVRIRPA